MRLLKDTGSAKAAKGLVDRLLVEGIEAQARPEDGDATEVWVLADGDLPRARELLEAGDATPGVARKAAAIRKQREREQEAWAHKSHDVRRRWNDGSKRSPGWITTFLIIATLVIAGVELFAETSGELMYNLTIDHWTSTSPLQKVQEGEVWRLLTPIFLHFGLFHLLFNLLWLERFGRQIESNHGPAVMVALVIGSALVGNVGQYVASGPSFGGLSGVNYALFGFIWMHARFNPQRSYSMTMGATILLMAWLVLCATGKLGPIANVGHAGGLLVGLLAGLPPYLRRVRSGAHGPAFEEGSWEDVSLTGFKRFRRKYIDPYVPLWFLAVSVAVAWTDFDRKRRPAMYETQGTYETRVVFDGLQACDELIAVLILCEARTDLSEDERRWLEHNPRSTYVEVAQVAEEEDANRVCTDVLEEAYQVLDFGACSAAYEAVMNTAPVPGEL